MNCEFVEGSLGSFKVSGFSCLCPDCKTRMVLLHKAFSVASHVLIAELSCPKCFYGGVLEVEMGGEK